MHFSVIPNLRLLKIQSEFQIPSATNKIKYLIKFNQLIILLKLKLQSDFQIPSATNKITYLIQFNQLIILLKLIDSFTRSRSIFMIFLLK
jgi:hypothetical protein